MALSEKTCKTSQNTINYHKAAVPSTPVRTVHTCVPVTEQF